jgi:hypothetical protein
MGGYMADEAHQEQPPQSPQSPFEAIRHANNEIGEYWSARELYGLCEISIERCAERTVVFLHSQPFYEQSSQSGMLM